MLRCALQKSRLLFAVLALAALLRPAVPARAAAYSYNPQQRVVNAGILLTDATGTNNTVPYVFYLLNQRNDIKPLGWKIVNPIAPKTVDSIILARHPLLGYQLGQQVTQAMFPYWEVPLSSTSFDSLLQFDILYLPVNAATRFATADMEKLRRFVDAGGQLWVEDTSVGITNSGSILTDPTATPNFGPLFFDMQFNHTGTSGAESLPISGGVPVRHPIISAPYFLSNQDLTGLGNLVTGSTPQTPFISASTGAAPPSTSLLTSVLLNGGNSLPLISAGQLGAGQIIVTDLGVGDAINNYVGPSNNQAAYCGNALYAADTRDLRFVVDILSWSEAHSSERKNSRQSGASPNAPSAAFAPSWLYTPGASSASSPLPGAALFGGVTYVRGADGVLHAFASTPGVSLTGSANPDNGLQDYSLGTSYDEIWHTNVGAYASAPTVATINGVTQVLVELPEGNIKAFDATTGSPASPPSYTPTGVAAFYSSTTNGGLPAPAPTYYDGRIYAGEPDGSLFVYDTNNANPASPPGTVYKPQTPVSGEYVSAPPTVGIINENGANDINAVIATNHNIYSLFLGARGELLRDTSPPAENSHTSKLNDILPHAHMFATPVGVGGLAVPRAYTTLTSGYPRVDTPPTMLNGIDPSPTYPFFPDDPAAVYPPGHTDFDPLSADYDVDFSTDSSGTPIGAGTLTRMTVGQGNLQAGPVTGPISAPAMDRSGYFYYTGCSIVNGVTDTLYCFQDNINPYNAKLVWRYRLPNENDGTAGVFTDADGVIYDKSDSADTLSGVLASGTNYQFVGAPVVDNNGNVYAVAANGTYYTVLCFAANPNGAISTDMFDSSSTQAQGGLSNVQVTQYNGLPTPGGGGLSSITGSNQFSTNGSGHVTFNNFASVGYRLLTPDMTEPQPVNVSYNGNTGQGQQPVALNNRPLHTNLRWYMIIPGAGSPSPLTMIGNYLFFAGGGSLYKVGASPQSIGMTPPSGIYYPKLVDPLSNNGDGLPMKSTLLTSLSGVSAVPSAGNGVMVLNGANGVSAFATQLTLVADNNRLLEADADGNAVWAVDSTKKMTLEGDIYYPGQTYGSPAQTSTGQLVTTHLELNRPTSVFQLTPNDYLVADTGNNRCVRFDRGGTVLWELTKFNDQDSAGAPVYFNSVTSAATTKTAPLLSPGESLTLNQPTSVQTYRNYYRLPGSPNVYTIVHYLVADTGNYRVLDIVDVFDANGQLVGPAHNLIWVSHTYDAQQRNYRYQSANFYVGANGEYYIAALVTNERIADLTAAQIAATTAPLAALAPASADGSGGSIVLLDYDPAGAYPADQKDGYIGIVGTSGSYHLDVINSLQAYLTPAGQFDINTAVAPPAGSTPTTIPLRNPRFLSVYTTKVVTGAVTTYPQNFLYTDDNGAFDLSPNGAVFTAKWGFTPADYKAMTTPTDVRGVNAVNINLATGIDEQAPFDRSGFPFIASCIQRTGADAVTDNASTYSVGRYTLTTSYSQGEAGNAAVFPPGFGGEVFDLHTVAIPPGGTTTTLQTQEVHYNNITPPVAPPGSQRRFSGHTLSRPGNTGPLTQPTFAVRAK